ARNAARAHHLRAYLEGMGGVLSESRRLIKSTGTLVLVVGDGTSQGLHVPLGQCMTEIAKKEGFILDRRPVRYQIQSRGFLTRQNPTSGLIESEWLLRFRPAS